MKWRTVCSQIEGNQRPVACFLDLGCTLNREAGGHCTLWLLEPLKLLECTPFCCERAAMLAPSVGSLC